MSKIDTRFPKMFGDESFETVLQKAKSLRDLKNLGPMTESVMHKAGIKTIKQFVKLGWKKSMIKLVKFSPKTRHAMFAYALIGALKNIDAFNISEEDKIVAKKLCADLKPKKLKK